MYPKHGDHADLQGEARENLIIGEVLSRISDEHVKPADLQRHIEGDLAGIIDFIRQKKIVDLGPRNNLKVIPTPPFMRGSYSVTGFTPHRLSPPPKRSIGLHPSIPPCRRRRSSPSFASTTITR